MLISPPFLPPKNAGETDTQWIERAMAGGLPGDGAYPVSFNLGWHGGIHLTTPPAAAGGVEPVRTIADGTVVYKRGAAQASDAPTGDHPLNYRGRRTSDGVVVIRHETEIGAARQGDAPTRVVFFSIYLHLHTVRDTVRPNRPIYRKDEIGQAGYIYGEPNKIHFEIICDDDNLQALIHRASGDVAVTDDGRDDAVFGELYFHLRADALVHAQRPALNSTASAGGTELGEDVFVGLRYAEGEGPAGQRGHLHVSSYRPDGRELGAALTVADAEYNLYSDANSISTAYPATGRPAPSAVYELLRFGRVLGPDALDPDTVPHWREIRTPTGTGWVNLNATDVHKFSDADFPQWRSWSVIDDSADRDSRCDSATLRGWLQGTTTTPLTVQQAEARLRDAAVRAKLAKAICKFPTEWDAASIEQRWGWLKTASEEHPEPLDEANFERLRAHIDALAFWAAALPQLQVPQYDAQGQTTGQQPLSNNHWHFDPREFIGQFRQCAWLSNNELERVMPNATSADVSRFQRALNMVSNKYFGASGIRRSHFLGQVSHETGELSGPMVERGNSRLSRSYETDLAYFAGPDTYPPMRLGAGYERIRNTLGNEYSPTGTGDGIKFRGRGSLQITGRAHYAAYWIYRGWLNASTFDASWWSQAGWWNVPRNPAIRPATIADPQRISARSVGNEYNPADVGGFFWVQESINQTCDPESMSSNIATLADAVSRIINRYDTPTFPARRVRVETAKRVLCDGA